MWKWKNRSGRCRGRCSICQVNICTIVSVCCVKYSILCYCVRARDHCCVLCDVTRDLLFTWYVVYQRLLLFWSTKFVAEWNFFTCRFKEHLLNLPGIPYAENTVKFTYIAKFVSEKVKKIKYCLLCYSAYPLRIHGMMNLLLLCRSRYRLRLRRRRWSLDSKELFILFFRDRLHQLTEKKNQLASRRIMDRWLFAIKVVNFRKKARLNWSRRCTR